MMYESQEDNMESRLAMHLRPDANLAHRLEADIIS